MVVLNLSHPITVTQQEQIEEITGQPIDRLIEIMPQFDNQAAFEGQLADLVDSIALSPTEWQTMPLLLNPPSYAPAAALLLAELHGRSGHFPAMLRLRPAAGSLPPHFEAAEVIDLQGVRDRARMQRS